MCAYTLDKTKTSTGTALGYVAGIIEEVTCDTLNCVYYWKCIKANFQDFPNCEYIGMTTLQFKDRLAEHRHNYPKRNVTVGPHCSPFERFSVQPIFIKSKRTYTYSETQHIQNWT